MKYERQFISFTDLSLMGHEAIAYDNINVKMNYKECIFK